jgi:hypothetical protein
MVTEEPQALVYSWLCKTVKRQFVRPLSDWTQTSGGQRERERERERETLISGSQPSLICDDTFEL